MTLHNKHKNKHPKGAQPGLRSQVLPSNPSNNRFKALETKDEEKEKEEEEHSQQSGP